MTAGERDSSSLDGESRDPDLLALLTAAEMRELERIAFAEGVVVERVVMESAGRSAAEAVAGDFPEGPVVAAVGRGNNGGDAIVALRSLAAWGREVLAVPVGGAELSPELTHGWEIPIGEPSAFANAGVIVDGILGTGASGPPRAPIAEAVEAMNRCCRPIVALDGPTGVDLTTGAVPGAAIRAAMTVTFGAVKRGLLLFPGRSLAGRILLAEVGFPPIAPGGFAAALITDVWACRQMPRVAPDAHKGEVGWVGVVAGRGGEGGAAIMAAMGALRAGCGGVRVVSAEANRLAIHAAVPEAVFLDRESRESIEGLHRTAALLIGPGIGTDEKARSLLESVVSQFEGPMLFDADALTLVGKDPSLLPTDASPRSVLTPHPGELARLLGRSTADILDDRFGAASEAAAKFRCTVLAKGAPSLVATPGQPVLVGTTGYSGVATGGMGDTLAGVIA
ncbi:MAG: NAD(P)H-hydrate dehydratase, partial [Gemmatimonas sp.]|nr:NAD(P)H-hydrate dehydratase [Gemmatimonas sp.]